VFGASDLDLWAWTNDAQVHWDGKRWQSRPFPGGVFDDERDRLAPVHAAIRDQIWVVDLAGTVRKFADDRWQLELCSP